MEITKNKIDELNYTIIVNIKEADYQEAVADSLKKYRKQVQLKGFRPGKAPIGLMKKMYGKQVLIEEVNKLLSESVDNYIKKEKLDILGELLPSEKEKTSFNIDKDKDFTFAFDIGLLPEINFNLDDFSTLRYDIIVDDNMLNKEIEHIQKNYGKYVEEEKATEKSKLTIDIAEIDKENKIIEAGVSNKEQIILVEMIKDEEIKKQIIGAEKDAIFNIDLKKAFPNEADLSALLAIDKTKLSEIESKFQIKINNIEKHVQAEINQELFDNAFQDKNLKTEEEFKELVTSNLKKTLSEYSTGKLQTDIKEDLMKNINVDFPEEFIVKWQLSLNNKEKDEKKRQTKEQIEKNLPKYLEQMKWELIKRKIVRDNKLEITQENEIDANKKITINQFVNYGIPMQNLNDELITNIAKQNYEKLKDEEKYQIRELAMEDKVFSYLIENINSELKDISIDDFNKLFEKKEQENQIEVEKYEPKDEKIEEKIEEKKEEKNDEQK